MYWFGLLHLLRTTGWCSQSLYCYCRTVGSLRVVNLKKLHSVHNITLSNLMYCV